MYSTTQFILYNNTQENKEIQQDPQEQILEDEQKVDIALVNFKDDDASCMWSTCLSDTIKIYKTWFICCRILVNLCKWRVWTYRCWTLVGSAWFLARGSVARLRYNLTLRIWTQPITQPNLKFNSYNKTKCWSGGRQYCIIVSHLPIDTDIC